MRLIIYQNIDSINEPQGYKYSIRLSYLLGFTTVSIGIGEGYYNFVDLGITFPLDAKIKILKNSNWETTEEAIEECEKSLKNFKKIKNKSSKLIVANKKLVLLLEDYFISYVEEMYEKLENGFGLKTMKEFLNPNDFYTFVASENDKTEDSHAVLPSIDLLQLLIPQEKSHPLFFLNIPPDFDYVSYINPKDKEAESVSSFYGSELINFPNLSLITSNQIALVREDLSIESTKFRATLNEWADICYENPNSNLGLKHFRQNLLPLQESADDLASKSPTLKGFTEFTNSKGGVTILFGEAPIETIWKIYLDTATISQEIFDKLLEIKKEQAPKFDGRWPVAVIRAIPNIEKKEEDGNENINSETAMKSVRKSISLD